MRSDDFSEFFQSRVVKIIIKSDDFLVAGFAALILREKGKFFVSTLFFRFC